MPALYQRDVRIIPLQFPPAFCLIILKHFTVYSLVPLNKKYLFHSLPIAAYPPNHSFYSLGCHFGNNILLPTTFIVKPKKTGIICNNVFSPLWHVSKIFFFGLFYIVSKQIHLKLKYKVSFAL